MTLAICVLSMCVVVGGLSYEFLEHGHPWMAFWVVVLILGGLSINRSSEE